MIMLRKLALMGSALAVVLASAGTAQAQLAVYDGANVAQTIQAVATAAKELAQLQQQLMQLQRKRCSTPTFRVAP